MKTRHLIRSSLAAALVLAGTGDLFAQALTVTDDLQLWLKADAGVMVNGSGGAAQWDDQSGNANHAVQPTDSLAPTLVAGALNGLPVLRFDGADDYLSVADSPSLSFTGDLTTFFVVRFDDFNTFRAVWAKTADNLPAPTDYYILPGSGLPNVYRGDGTFANLGNFVSTTPLTAGSYLTVGFGMEGSVCTHFIASQPASSGTLAVAAANTGAPLLIGTRGDLFTKMQGDIAEILIYSRALTAPERASVASYLGNKYGIANLPPTASLAVTPAGPTHAAGDTVTLAATANDPDGSIATVKFFANGSLLGTASAPPYRIRATLETAGSYTFTARATDDKNATGDSADVTRTVTAGAPPPLDVTSTLQLWLKADADVSTGFDGEVLEWGDQSGNANNASQSESSLSPILTDNVVNGKPALHFDGVDDYLSAADSDSLSITGDITSFFVVRMDDLAFYRAVWGKTVGNLPAPTDYYTAPNSGKPVLYRGNGTGNGLASLAGTSGLHAGAFDLVGFSATASTLTHFLNGSPNGTGSGTTSTADGDTPLLIGTRGDLFTKLKGDLAELLIYNSALSADDLHNVQVYLAAKYGLPLATAVNDAPTVMLTAPAPGGSVVAPADVLISADAGDADGSVVKVEFMVNGGVAATDLTAAYSATVNFPAASTATIVARATDNLGAVTLSDPVTLTVTAAEPIPLPALANLRLWLRADKGVTETAGAVSAWDDQSGNFNNTTQTTASRRPTLVADAINGKPVLRFDGADDSLVAPSSPTLAITGDISTFFVVKFSDFGTYRAVWAKTAGPGGNLPASTDFYTLPGSAIPRVFRGNGGASLGFVDGVQPPVAGEYTIIGFDQAGTTLHHYLNGEQNGVGEITATLGDTGAPLYIGTRGDQFTRMKGDIAEVIIYDSALSDTDRATLLAYLGTRYGIATTPPLSIVNNHDGTVTVSWPASVAGWELEFASNVQGPWDPVTSGVVNNSFTDFIGERGFYRLHKL